MPKDPNKAIKKKSAADSSGEGPEVAAKLDEMETRFNIVINILLEILFSNQDYQGTIPYTEKVGYLADQGLQTGDVAKIVGRPSNWVSNRLKEYKKRKRTKRQAVGKAPVKPRPEAINRAKA